MARFDIPEVQSNKLWMISSLLGVDYSTNNDDLRRASKLVNMINNNGSLEKRNGHEIVTHVANGRINGVWNIDARGSEYFVVHCGQSLFEVNLTTKEQILIMSDLNDVKSSGLYLNGKLLILDGKKAIVYGEFGDDWEARYADNEAYVPISVIATKPDGTGGENYEQPNQLSNYKWQYFIGDGESSEYQLEGDDWADEKPVVLVLNADGEKVADENITFDHTKGVVTFANIPGRPLVDGQDNVFIKFKVTDMVNNIDKCRFGIIYGYEGNNNRAFVSGNPDLPNMDWYTGVDDVTYFPTTAFAKIGTEPITGYSRLMDGTLATHKKISDTDFTTYYRTYNTLNGKEIFPLLDGVKTIGCLNNFCCENFLNDAVFLSELGIYSFNNRGSYTNNAYARERSYYIKNELLREPDLDKAVAIVNGTRYYLAINNKLYVADKRFLSSEKHSYSDYQYEWFKWENIPVSTMFNWNNKLYFGDDEGYIRTFTDNYVDQFMEDGELVETPVSCYWESIPISFDNLVNAKTVRKIYLHSNQPNNNSFTIGYIDIDGVTEILDVHTAEDVYEHGIPSTTQQKQKITKFMYIKVYVEDDTDKNCTFDQIIFEYKIAGKYRGE